MRACTQAGRRTERGDERATGWNDGAASGGRNRGAMVAALSAADHDRAVLGRQFDRRSRGARSGAARGAGLLALGDRAGAAAAARLAAFAARLAGTARSEEHTSKLQSLMRSSYAVFCLKKKKIMNHTQSYSSIMPTILLTYN